MEAFRDQGHIIDKIIQNNKTNELFRIAWKDLINESTTDFERERLLRLRERVKESRQHQEWKTIVINSPDASTRNIGEHKEEEMDTPGDLKQVKLQPAPIQERTKQLYENRNADQNVKRKQSESIKAISQQIENMMLDFSKNRNQAELQRLKRVREKNRHFRLLRTATRGGQYVDSQKAADARALKGQL